MKRRRFFERRKSVPALACDFEREMFLAYNKIASRDRLLLSYNFYDGIVKAFQKYWNEIFEKRSNKLLAKQ